MELFQIILLSVLGVCAICLLVANIQRGMELSFRNRKKGELEGRLLLESTKIVWRLVNKGTRNITVVEIGVRCGDKITSYRPLFSQTEEVNSIPYIIGPGEIASFRKDGDRFRFRPLEVSALKVSNPFIYFFVKDAEGTVYETKSEIRFTEYLDRIDRIVSTPR